MYACFVRMGPKACICSCMHTFMHSCMWSRPMSSVSVRLYVRVEWCKGHRIHACMHAGMYVYVCTHVCMQVRWATDQTGQKRKTDMKKKPARVMLIFYRKIRCWKACMHKHTHTHKLLGKEEEEADLGYTHALCIHTCACVHDACIHTYTMHNACPCTW